MSVVQQPDVGTTPVVRHAWWQRISLTKQLVATILGTVALALFLSGGLAFPLLRHTMLVQKQQELSGAVGRYDFGTQPRLDEHDRHGPTTYYVAYLTGNMLQQGATSNSTTDVPDPRVLLGLKLEGDNKTFSDVPSTTGATRWMVQVREIDHGPLAGSIVFVAAPLNELNRTLTKYGVGLVGLSCLVLPLAGLVGAVAVRRALQPLRDVEQVATAFGDGDTTRRVAGLAPQTEVGRVGASVNLMLDQINDELAARQESEARMRRFVGDASHELRTPLAAVRGFAELYRMGAVQQPDEVAGVMRRIEDEAKRMGVLVEDLLLLARMDEQRPMQLSTVDLGRIARDATQDAHALAPERDIALQGLDGGEPRPVALIGDEAHLRQVVTNLVANAIRHTPRGSPIELQVGDQQGSAIFRVVDHGAGIPAEQQHRVFERFFRADSSRSRATGGGSGLGLAIVAAITAAHHGRVRVVTTPDGGATFELAIPQTWQGPRDNPVTTTKPGPAPQSAH